ncbi:MAG: DUF5320 domain-containing protein [Promethearchaeota archaeon]
MPRGDGTGPRGLGSMTGRALGYCAGYDTPGYFKGPGMGLGRGSGRGGGWRRWGGLRYGNIWGYGIPTLVPPPVYSPTITPETQLGMLKQEKQYLESDLEGLKSAIDDISKRIEELEKSE